MWTGSALADRLRAHLTTLYGHRASAVADQVIRLIELHAPRIKPRQKSSWDEKDIILITYGDQITDGRRPTLEVLRDFLSDHRLVNLFRILHLLPIFPASSDDGFSVVDYRQVDARLGTWDHIRELASHFDLMIDLVLNHVSRKSAYFQGYLAREARFANFFIEAVPDPLLVQVVRPRNTPLLTPVETKAGRRYVWTTFSDDQVDLNYAEPAVLLEILDVLLFYLEQGVRILRLDAVPYLWKRLGTPCINLPETHEIVKVLRCVVDAVAPGTLLLTETNIPEIEGSNYFGFGDEAHLVYQFSLPALVLDAFLNGGGAFLSRFLAHHSSTPLGTTVVNFLASHDGIPLRGLEAILPPDRLNALVDEVIKRGGCVSHRLAPNGAEVPCELNITYFSALSEPGGREAEVVRRRFVAAHAFLLALRGIPAVYILSLFATPNYLEGVKQTGRNRTINRRKFELSELNAMLSDSASEAAQVFGAMKRLAEVRLDQPAFHPEAPQLPIDTGNPNLVSFKRESLDGSQHIVVVLNVGKNPEKLSPDALAGRRPIRNLLSGPELSFLSTNAPGDSAGQQTPEASVDALIPPGGIVWWEVT
ncbi:MAG: sugar phosphorylase [Thermoguttaceae bacterium]|nr:sugar phosphorylase [Thermoguttaceae bacterium]MDW8078767.1 sugar phosphorylase [Thermoguttaceae bacterium]